MRKNILFLTLAAIGMMAACTTKHEDCQIYRMYVNDNLSSEHIYENNVLIRINSFNAEGIPIGHVKINYGYNDKVEEVGIYSFGNVINNRKVLEYDPQNRISRIYTFVDTDGDQIATDMVNMYSLTYTGTSMYPDTLIYQNFPSDPDTTAFTWENGNLVKTTREDGDYTEYLYDNMKGAYLSNRNAYMSIYFGIGDMPSFSRNNVTAQRVYNAANVLQDEVLYALTYGDHDFLHSTTSSTGTKIEYEYSCIED